METLNKEKETAIKISGVKKKYKLGQIGGGSLREDIQSWWARKRGKEDPNSIIGQDQRLVGKTFMALNGIDLTIHKGEALGIIGSNGAGKSTLLKLLCQVTAPTEGDIDIYGRITSMLEVGTGFNGEMTGRENIYMNGTILGMTKAEIDSKMDDIIEFSEVGDFIDTPVKRYSSGMFIKLGFAVASHLESEIMIMDEVLAVGDMAFQKKCLGKMREAATKEGRTILYVSHNMNTIRQLCDRCIVLDKGKIVFQGEVEKAISIYSDNEKVNDTRIDYKNYVRKDYFTPLINMSFAEFVNKDNTYFFDDESMTIRLGWKNLKDVEDVGLRIEIWTLDDVVQGSYVLYDIYSGKAENRAEMKVKLDISMLAEAEYRIIFTFFQKNDVGLGIDIENVRGLCFTKKIKNLSKKLMWQTKYWGHMVLPIPHEFQVKSL